MPHYGRDLAAWPRAHRRSLRFARKRPSAYGVFEQTAAFLKTARETRCPFKIPPVHAAGAPWAAPGPARGRIHAGPGQVRPAWQGGGAPQGTPPLVSYFFRFSATSSAMCETLTFMPCFSTPPRSCMTQPGQSMTTREAPVSSMCFSFLASSVPEISGNFME